MKALESMSVLVLAVGLMNVGAGLLGALAPAAFRRLVTRFWKAKQGYLSALLVRLSFSAMLILGSRHCRFSLFIMIAGILSAIMALSILFVGEERQNRLREWTLARPDRAVRTESLLGIVLGGVLIYAAL